jgi:DNA-binding response OmpR family regulator
VARTILLVEDEESISEPLARALERQGFEAVVRETATDAVAAFRERPPDLVLLDLMLPDGDGRDVLREVRSESRVPVIVLTARGDELDRVVGLELGADDYVTKPFSAAELLARIRAVLRRTDEAGGQPRPAVVEAGDVRMDVNTHLVTTTVRAPRARTAPDRPGRTIPGRARATPGPARAVQDPDTAAETTRTALAPRGEPTARRRFTAAASDATARQLPAG